MIAAMRVGIMADTHGLLRPRVLELLEGCDQILHAGDVGTPDVLARLRALAPVTAVRGNVDNAGELTRLPDDVGGELGTVRYRMTHRREDVGTRWAAEHDLLVFGHSHRPEVAWRGNCLLLNPGACGPRRFHLPLTLAVLEIHDGRISPELRNVE